MPSPDVSDAGPACRADAGCSRPDGPRRNQMVSSHARRRGLVAACAQLRAGGHWRSRSVGTGSSGRPANGDRNRSPPATGHRPQSCRDHHAGSRGRATRPGASEGQGLIRPACAGGRRADRAGALHPPLSHADRRRAAPVATDAGIMNAGIPSRHVTGDPEPRGPDRPARRGTSVSGAGDRRRRRRDARHSGGPPAGWRAPAAAPRDGCPAAPADASPPAGSPAGSG